MGAGAIDLGALQNVHQRVARADHDLGDHRCRCPRQRRLGEPRLAAGRQRHHLLGRGSDGDPDRARDRLQLLPGREIRGQGEGFGIAEKSARGQFRGPLGEALGKAR